MGFLRTSQLIPPIRPRRFLHRPLNGHREGASSMILQEVQFSGRPNYLTRMMTARVKLCLPMQKPNPIQRRLKSGASRSRSNGYRQTDYLSTGLVACVILGMPIEKSRLQEMGLSWRRVSERDLCRCPSWAAQGNWALNSEGQVCHIRHECLRAQIGPSLVLPNPQGYFIYRVRAPAGQDMISAL